MKPETQFAFVSNANHIAFVAAAASVQVLGPNPKRLAIIFGSPSAGPVSFAFGQPAVLDSGLTIRTGGPPITLTRQDIGDAITQPMHGIGSAAAEACGIVEITALN